MTTFPLIRTLTSSAIDVTMTGLPTQAIVACASQFVSAAVATELVDSCRVWARAATLARDVAIDREPALRSHDVITAHACQFEALKRLAKFFTIDEAWSELERLLETTLGATAVEAACRAGDRELASFDFPAAIDHAHARNAVSAAWVVALATVSREFARERMLAIHRHLALAAQAINDATAWKLDTATSRPSLVLAGLPAPRVTAGALVRTYDLALAELTGARETAEGLGVVTMVVQELEARARRARELIATARA